MTKVMLENPLPSAPETERIVIGLPLLDNKIFAQLADLPDSTFHHPHYRAGFKAMQNLWANNKPISPHLVFEELQAIDSNLQLTTSEITNWSYGLPSYSNISTELNILKDKALKRRLIRQCGEIARKTANESDLGTEIISDAVNSFQNIYSESLDRQKPTVQLSEGLTQNYERWEKMLRKEIVTVETGIDAVDNRLTGGGLEKGMFHVIGARPGKGKTSIGLDIAGHNALQNKTVVFFTLELSRDVLLDRFISPYAGIERYKITSKWMNDRDFKKLVAVSEFLKERPFHINHKARTAKDMRLALKETARQTGGEIDLIIVDFLTKMHGAKQNKYESVSYNANCLAEFAVEFNSAVICLAQFHRPEKGKAEEKPSQSDFRDSGEIEELGRTVFGLWGNDETKGFREVNISCLKQGEGEIFDEKLVFDTNFMTFGGRQCLIK